MTGNNQRIVVFDDHSLPFVKGGLGKDLYRTKKDKSLSFRAIESEGRKARQSQRSY